jgi:phosphoenolpyruvate carboxykinase (ATP)
MFLQPEAAELANFAPEWTVLCVPVLWLILLLMERAKQFAILDFTKVVLIGGTGYTGEMKRNFSALNFIYLFSKIHYYSANVGKDGDTAIFFGLSELENNFICRSKP